jgi:hypothetical protein
MKTCNRCFESQELTEFHKCSKNPDGLFNQCKACRKRINADRYYRDPKKVLEITNRWRNNNRDVVRKSEEAFRERHKDRLKAYRESRRDFDRERLREWKKNNKGKVNAQTWARRAKKLQATPSWASKEAIEEKYRLAQFFQDLSGGFVKYHVDHIVPLRGTNVCGLHVENNLQILKAVDNIKKGNKHDDPI